MFKWLINKRWVRDMIAEHKRKKAKEREVRKYYDITRGGGISLTNEGIALIKKAIMEDKERAMGDQPSIAANLVPGELSANVDWMGIETIGDYLTPFGNDNKHTIIITKAKRKAGIVTVAKIECTNSLYSEWVVCLCETSWHTKQKVLEDIHGNRYPVGDMCECQCEIRYA